MDASTLLKFLVHASAWFLKRNQKIIKYGTLIFCVCILITIMLFVIPEGKGFKGFFATILRNLEGISIFTAAVLYFLESGDRKQRKHYEAWQVIDAAKGVETSYARIQALQDLNKDGVSLARVNFSETDLRSITLIFTNLSDANLSRANLRGANLRGAYLRGANFSSAYLSRANFRGANFRGANFSRANLRGADLRGADLEAADLSDANLRDANLKGANLSSANLRGADLSGVKDLTPEQVKQAKNWEKAEYHEEFRAKLDLPPV